MDYKYERDSRNGEKLSLVSANSVRNESPVHSNLELAAVLAIRSETLSGKQMSADNDQR